MLRQLDWQRFEQSFRAWVGQVAGKLNPTVIVFNGNTLCGSRDGGQCAVHRVSAYASAYGLTLDAVGVQSSEVTALPELLKVLDVREAIVSIDAMDCQQAIAAQVHEQGRNYLLGLKANHPGWLEEAEYFFGEARVRNWHAVLYG